MEKNRTELELLEMIEKIPLPPFAPFILIKEELGIAQVSNTLRKYFKKLDIEVKDQEPTKRILKLCKKYSIVPIKMITILRGHRHSVER